VTRRGIGWLVAFAALVLLLWSRQRYEPLSYYSSRSYVQRANALIRKEALQYSCRDNRIHLTDKATAAERKWFEESYLEHDVELFNGNRELFGHFFLVQDCRLRELNPYLRTVRLPFAQSLEWRGNIAYSGPGSNATLVSSNGRTIDLMRHVPNSSQREVRTTVGSTGDVAAHAVHLDFPGGSSMPAVEIHTAGNLAVLEQRMKGGTAGEVRLLGNSVTEGRIARLAAGDWLYLSSTEPREASETFLYTAERRFERLSTVRTRNAKRERTYSEDEPLLRWVGGEEGEEMLTFGEALARSVTHALQQLDETRARQLAEKFDIQLSVDRSLQASLDETLRTYAGALVRNAAAGDPFPASVTVMNGKTGEILAAASFPSQSDLEALRGVNEDERRRLAVNHNFKRHPIGSAGKPFFYASAVSRHPFLLDLAVAPHGPDPAPRKDGGVGEREVLQFFTGRDYKLWPHQDAWTDLGLAIERSCNKFTIELATLALAAPRDLRERTLTVPLDQVFTRQPDVVWPRPGQTSGIRIGSQLLDFAPSLGVHMKDDWKPVRPSEETTAVITPGTLDRIDEAQFVEAFAEITGVRKYAGVAAPDVPAGDASAIGRSAMVTMHYDLRPWRQLVERFTANESSETAWKLRAAFQAVSPERVNLAFNQVNQFRTELVSLLLGGSTSQWTNIQLAEALSRLVTKRQVEATMLHAIRERDAKEVVEPEAPAFADLAVTDEARTAVLSGMTRVVLGAQGTARPLAPLVRQLETRFPGYHVALFSKTGSPTVTRPEARPVGEILSALVLRGRLFGESEHLAVSPDGKRVVPYARPGTPGRAAYRSALDQAARAIARAVGVSASTRTLNRIAAYTDRFETNHVQLSFPTRDRVRLSENVSSPIHMVAGQLILNRDHTIFDPTQQTDSSAMYILSVAKWRGNPGVPSPAELAQPDSRVVTAVFYFDVGPGSPVAVEAARLMLPRIVKLLE
jgi:cell division protein FtsI/penicillin-binding protein 2